MNQPSYSSFEILQQLKTSLPAHTNLSDLLPSIVIVFRNEADLNLVSEIISVILGPTAQKVPLEDLETLILRPCLILVKQYVLKIMSAIHEELQAIIFEDDLQEIKNYIEICTKVLDDVNAFLSYIASIEEVTVPGIFSVPTNIAELIFEVFSHCQKSKEEYKSSFSIVRNELMCLFQSCHKVQLNLFMLLNEKLYFNCKYESELELLINTMDILASMAEVVADLDTMSLVAHWKGYALLTQKYAIHLRPRLDIDRPIAYLAANISNQLSNLPTFTQNNEKKLVLRALKITSLQLKVLIKLCEHYNGYLGDSLTKLLDCLITLCVNTSNYLEQEGVPPDIVSLVMSQVSAGAAPLTTHLLSDQSFIKIYLLFLENLHQKPLLVQAGFCQLTNLILKKLTLLCSKDEEILNLWISPNLHIIEILFNLLHECSKGGELTVLYKEDIYQPLLVNATGLLVTHCSTNMFPLLERYLYQHLLQPTLWPALFTSDLICLVGRFGSSDLCNQLTCLLSNLLDLWPNWDRQRPEWVYVTWTTARLTHLLSEEHSIDFQSKLPSYSIITNNLSIMLKASHAEENNVNFEYLVKSLNLLAEFSLRISDVSSGLTEYLYELWQCLAATFGNDSSESLQWLYGIYTTTVLATCALVNSLSNIQILNILNVLTSLSTQNVSLFTCGACEFLRTLATKTFSTDTALPDICHKMSSLFVQLMKNEDPVIKSFVLETFSFFAYHTKYEQIVADAVENESKIQVEITNYLEYIPVVHFDEHLNLHLKSLLQTFLHKCKKERSNKISADLVPNPCKKLKVSEEKDLFSETLQKIEEDLNQLENIYSSSAKSQNHFLRLNTFITRLNKLLK